MTEEELIKGIVNDDNKVWNYLYDTIKPKAKVFYERSGGGSNFEDIFQSTMIAISENIKSGKFQGRASLYTYILAVFRILLIHYKRKLGKDAPIDFLTKIENTYDEDNAYFYEDFIKNQSIIDEEIEDFRIDKDFTIDKEIEDFTIETMHSVRKVWYDNDWWFVIEDTIKSLKKIKDPQKFILNLLKNNTELNTIWEKTVKYLILESDNGREKKACANSNGLLLILSQIPSIKSKRLKKWFAQIEDANKIEEVIDEVEEQMAFSFILFNNQSYKRSDLEEISRYYSHFLQKREEHIYLAALAAFPLHITADLLYKIWQNFKNTEGGVEIPRVAVSDLLLSGLLHEVSTELFEYPPDLRRTLLQALQEFYKGRDILRELGEFMLDYLATHYSEGVAYTEPIREAEEWNALAYSDAAKANAKLAAALNPSASKNYQTRQLRAVLLTEKLETQSNLRTLDPSVKMDFERVLTFSKGIKPYIQGDYGKAFEQLQQLPEFRVLGENERVTEGGATLELPKVVVPVPKIQQLPIEDNRVVELLEANLIILGEPRVGKTSLIRKLTDVSASLPSNLETTRGIEIVHYEFKNEEGKIIKVNIKDFGGQQIYSSMHQFFLNKDSLYLLVYDSDNRYDVRLEYWLNIIEILGNRSPVIIIQNKKDLRNQGLNLEVLNNQFTNIKGHYLLSLKSGEGLIEAQKAIEENIQKLPNIGTILPYSWVSIRNQLEKLAQIRNYISIDELINICKEHQVVKIEDVLSLSTYLHDLGIIINIKSDNLLQNFIILNIEWVTTAFYKLLDHPMIRDNKGKFTSNDIDLIWNQPNFSKQIELLELLKMLELVYKYTNAEGINIWLIPQLLPLNKPKFEWNYEGEFVMKYVYKFLPYNFIARFIIRKSSIIKRENLVWRYGVVLGMDNSEAWITENIEEKEIVIRTNGYQAQELMDLVIEEFDKIHAQYSNLEFELKTGAKSNIKEKEKIRQLIGMGKLKEALKLFADSLSEDENVSVRDIVQLNSQLVSLNERIIKGIISFEETRKQENNISNRILSLLDLWQPNEMTALEKAIYSSNTGKNIELGVLQMVNCDRLVPVRKFRRAFQEKEQAKQAFQFYFICGCPTEMPHSLASRFAYEILDKNGVFDKLGSYVYDDNDEFSRIKVQPLPFIEGDIEASQKKFKQYLQARFKIANMQSIEAFIQTEIYKLPYPYILTVFRITEDNWETDEGEIISYLQWMIDFFPKNHPNAPTFIFLFVVNIRHLYDKTKVTVQQQAIVENLETFCKKNSAPIFHELAPVSDTHIESWLTNVGIDNPNNADKVINALYNSIPKNDRLMIDGERRFHMKDVEMLQEKIIKYFRNKK